MISGRVRALNLTVPLGSGQTISGTGRVRASVLSPCRPLGECQIYLLLPLSLLLPLLPQLPPVTSPLSTVFFFLTSLFCFIDFPFEI